jgi:hypothetical protein
MDAVDIVMLTEERFGVEIRDEEAEALRTPRMLIDLVFAKLAHATAARCQSQRSFYLLRRALTVLSGTNKNAVSPSSPIRSFVSSGEERRFWERLRHETKARSWPSLGFSAAVSRAGKAVFVLLSVCGLAAAWNLGLFTSAGSALSILAFGLLGPALFMLFIAKAMGDSKNYIPARITFLRDLVPFVATSDSIDWSRDEVACGVRDIVEEVLAPQGKYREDADFVRDLGLT